MGRFESLAEVTFIGHSHLALAFRLPAGPAVGEDGGVEAIVAKGFTCDAANKFIITVGSVGQPRDRNPQACCGVFDTTSRLFEYHRVAYDSQTTRQKIAQAGLPSMFGERLLFGI